MTVWSLLRAAWVSWWLVLIGGGVTVIGCAFVLSVPGVYWSEVDAVFLAPRSARFQNTYQVSSQSIIATAGVVQREVSGGLSRAQVVSDAVTLVGQGVRSGEQVVLPNAGGQWANNFNRPVLELQVAGRDPVEVQQRLDGLFARVEASLRERQAAAGAPAEDLITVSKSPAAPSVRYQSGDRRQSLAACVLLGLGLTVAAVSGWERRRRRTGVPVGQTSSGMQARLVDAR